MFALVSFTHFDLTVRRGDEFPKDHPMVVARPDLFAKQPPTPARKSTKATATAKASKEN